MGVTWRENRSVVSDGGIRSEKNLTQKSIQNRARRLTNVPHGSGSCVAKIVCLLILAAPFSFTTIWAVTLKGTFTSEWYARTTAGSEHFRPYASLRTQMPLYRGNRGRVSFKTYLRWTTDVLDAGPDDPQLFVYDAYLRYQAPRRLGELSLGRQFVYSGVGSDLLDGVRLRVGPHRRATLELFVGSSVDRLNPEKVRSLTDFSVLGGRLSCKPIAALPLALSWHRRERDGEVSFHRLGLNGSYSWQQFRIYGRLARNMIDKSLATVQFRTGYRNRPWYFSAEYLFREPSVSGNSVFSLIETHSWRQVRFVGQRSLPHRLNLNSQLQVGLFEDDNTWRFGLGLSSVHWRADWFHQSGRGGDNSNLRGSVNSAPIYGWTCYSSVSLGWYRVQEQQEDRSVAHGIAVGASRRIAGHYALRIEAQRLRNAVQSNDTRLYVRFSRDFSIGGEGGR